MRQAELRQCLIQDLCSKKKLSSPGFSPSHRELNALHPELVRFLPTWSARYPCAKGDATPRIRGVALQARCYQLRLFREVQTVMDALAKHEIAFAVCKGVSVMSLAGLAPGDRILHDVDLLLRERDAVWVVDYLRSQGWKERMGKAGDRLRISHHVDWVSPAGNRLNLQWALLGEELNPDRVDQALERRIPLNPGCGLKGQGLSLRDQLFQSVIAGQESWKGGSIRWIVDSCLLLREEEREVPWSELWNDWEKADVGRAACGALRSLQTFRAVEMQRAGRWCEGRARWQMWYREKLSRFFGLFFLYHRWFSESRKRVPGRAPTFGTWLGKYTGIGSRRALPGFFFNRLVCRIRK